MDFGIGRKHNGRNETAFQCLSYSSLMHDHVAPDSGVAELHLKFGVIEETYYNLSKCVVAR